MSRLLSYGKIPKPLLEAIGDFRQVSSQTASEIVRLIGRDEQSIGYSIEIAQKIKTGTYGYHSIQKESKRRSEKITNDFIKNKKVFHVDGRYFLTWRLDSNDNPCIHLSNDISRLIRNNQIDLGELTGEIKTAIANRLLPIKE